jgi:hypothetical protein
VFVWQKLFGHLRLTSLPLTRAVRRAAGARPENDTPTLAANGTASGAAAVLDGAAKSSRSRAFLGRKAPHDDDDRNERHIKNDEDPVCRPLREKIERRIAPENAPPRNRVCDRRCPR